MSHYTRREVIRMIAAAMATAPLAPLTRGQEAADRVGPLLPTRPLGHTGEQVTCLGLGGYHIHWTTEAQAQATIEAALEEGVRFFDTAESYGPHTSEERFGKYLTPRYRDDVFIMTKSTARSAQAAREHLEGSLRRMKIDTVDLWQIHAIGSPEDVDHRLQGGVLEMALEARDAGKIRHIGFTGHRSPYAHQRMIEATADRADEPFAACQFPINPVDFAAAHSFVRTVLPAANQRNLGALAMKTLADGRFFGSKTERGRTVWTSDDPVVPGALSVADCIHFALSLPISVLITGAENPEYLREKAALARQFQAMSADQRQALADRVARFAQTGRVEYYKAKNLSA